MYSLFLCIFVHFIYNFFQFKDTLDSGNIVLSEGVARIKGTPVSAGKIRGRCCVAMSLDEAQNIQVVVRHQRIHY